MLPLRQAGDIETAPLKNSCPSHREVVEAVGTLRNGCLAVVAARILWIADSAADVRANPHSAIHDRQIPTLYCGLYSAHDTSGFQSTKVPKRLSLHAHTCSS